MDITANSVTYNVIDNFLPPEQFEEVRDSIMYHFDFPWYIHKRVNTVGKNCTEEYWNWYATHTFYKNDYATSQQCHRIYDIFIPRFLEMYIYHSLLRIKGNFYPHTETLKEHSGHEDYPFSNTGALYSLNTCDGYTKLYDGTKIPSVANRILIFDSSMTHNSTTTTNAAGRFNINFNFL